MNPSSVPGILGWTEWLCEYMREGMFPLWEKVKLLTDCPLPWMSQEILRRCQQIPEQDSLASHSLTAHSSVWGIRRNAPNTLNKRNLTLSIQLSDASPLECSDPGSVTFLSSTNMGPLKYCIL